MMINDNLEDDDDEDLSIEEIKEIWGVDLNDLDFDDDIPGNRG